MNIGIIAHNSKKTLIEDFCIAYKGILGKHEIYATGTTGRRIEEVTNLRVHKFLAGSVGGDKQFMDMIERNCMDMVIFFLTSSYLVTVQRPRGILPAESLPYIWFLQSRSPLSSPRISDSAVAILVATGILY